MFIGMGREDVDAGNPHTEAVDCPVCDGSGVIACADCNGLGVTDCLNCTGSGCEDCREGDVPCDSCRGRGETSCEECGGCGEVMPDDRASYLDGQREREDYE